MLNFHNIRHVWLYLPENILSDKYFENNFLKMQKKYGFSIETNRVFIIFPSSLIRLGFLMVVFSVGSIKPNLISI